MALIESNKRESGEFTCLTCKIKFDNVVHQQEHYRSDWHRYNLKRKIVGLNSLPLEIYKTKIKTEESQADNNEKELKKNKKLLFKRKLFKSKNTFVDHLKSSKHKEKEHFLSVNNVNIDEADFQSEVWEDISDFAWSSEICLFCNFKSETMALSIKHMTEKHSFFIPDYDYIIDVEGFINYLGEKIYKNFTCLKCNEKGRTFLSAEAVQKHMRDKGHNTISFEREETLEYSDYYDYRPSYPDYDPDNPEHNMIPQLDSPRIDFETAELVAPDGTRAAHRSLLYYYKRYSLRDGCVVVTTKKSCEVNSFAPPQSRFLRNSQRYKAELDKKWYTRLGSKTNSLQRRYFRPQVIF